MSSIKLHTKTNDKTTTLLATNTEESIEIKLPSTSCELATKNVTDKLSEQITKATETDETFTVGPSGTHTSLMNALLDAFKHSARINIQINILKDYDTSSLENGYETIKLSNCNFRNIVINGVDSKSYFYFEFLNCSNVRIEGTFITVGFILNMTDLSSVTGTIVVRRTSTNVTPSVNIINSRVRVYNMELNKNGIETVNNSCISFFIHMSNFTVFNQMIIDDYVGVNDKNDRYFPVERGLIYIRYFKATVNSAKKTAIHFFSGIGFNITIRYSIDIIFNTVATNNFLVGGSHNAFIQPGWKLTATVTGGGSFIMVLSGSYQIVNWLNSDTGFIANGNATLTDISPLSSRTNIFIKA